MHNTPEYEVRLNSQACHLSFLGQARLLDTVATFL